MDTKVSWPDDPLDDDGNAHCDRSISPIHFYNVSDSHGHFSNFYSAPIHIDDKLWPTSEHYFQAAKFPDSPVQETIRNMKKPLNAAREGRSRSNLLRKDWAAVKEQVMERAVYAKYTQHPDLREKILETGNAPLVEHTENDLYWGDGGDQGTGKSRLGVILMRVRTRLRESQASSNADANATTENES